MSGFHGAFATGVASQQGTLTLPDTWFRLPFWDLLYCWCHSDDASVLLYFTLLMLQLLRPKFLELAMSLLDFSPRIPLGTFSILLEVVVSGRIKNNGLCKMRDNESYSIKSIIAKEHCSLPKHIARTLTARRICLGLVNLQFSYKYVQ